MLDFLAAFLTAALSATGVGGGGLLILYLRLVKNMPVRILSARCRMEVKQKVNLIFFTVSSACAAVVHFFRRKLRLQTVLICGVFGFCGAFLGFAVVRNVDVTLLEKIFGALIALCGIKTFFAAKRQ